MFKDESRFVIILLVLTVAICCGLFYLNSIKHALPLADFSVISSVIQGTLGVAVSFAGALVAIKLARLSTAIIEKEKQREDEKIYYQVISESLQPIKILADTMQEFYDESFNKHTPLLRKVSRSLYNKNETVSSSELTNFKIFIDNYLLKVINAIEGIRSSSYGHALWLHISSGRLSKNSLLYLGGGARPPERNDTQGLQGNLKDMRFFIIEDLSYLSSVLKKARYRMANIELTQQDLEASLDIYRTDDDASILSSSLTEPFYFTATYISLYLNIPYNSHKPYPDFKFGNRFLALLLDLYYNFPQKENLIDYCSSIFNLKSDDKSLFNNPQLRVFDILKSSYWVGFQMSHAIESLDTKPIRENIMNNIFNYQFSNEKCSAKWHKWYTQKNLANVISS